MSDYKPKTGDRVRVTFEGTVSARVAGDTYFVMGDENDSVPVWPGAPVVSVEKVEPAEERPEPQYGEVWRLANGGLGRIGERYDGGLVDVYFFGIDFGGSGTGSEEPVERLFTADGRYVGPTP